MVRRDRRNSKNKDDLFLRLTAVQLTAAVLIFMLLFLLMKKDNGLADRIKIEIDGLMAEDWDLAGMFDEDSRRVFSEEGTKETENGICLPAIGTPETDHSACNNGLILTSAALTDESLLSAPLTSCFYCSETPVLPVCGPVTSDYGERIHPITGEESFHSGRDIAADEGTPIFAVYDGVVAATGVGELSGNYVKIKHDETITALYCHCSEVYVSEGDYIRKGDIIAAVGHTGSATGPHLHFEIRKNGELIPPSEILDRAIDAR